MDPLNTDDTEQSWRLRL